MRIKIMRKSSGFGLSYLTILIISGLIAGFLLSGVMGQIHENTARAAQGENPKTSAIKHLSGNLVSFYPRKQPTTIGVSYDAENTDYYFIIDENTKVINKKKMTEIQRGDRVQVTFEEITEIIKTKEGEDREKITRIAKVVKYLGPKRK